MAERGPEGRRRSAATSAAGPAASSGRRSREPAGSSPLTSPAGGRVGEAGRTRRTGAGSRRCRSGSNSMAWFGRGRRNRKRSCSGRDHLDDLVGRHAAALGGGHLAAADVQELVRDVERRLALEDLAGDRVGPVARAAGGRQVLAARLDGHPEELHWAAHSRFQPAWPGRRTGPPSRTCRSRSPTHELRPALVEDLARRPTRSRSWYRSCRSSRRRPGGDASRPDAGRWRRADRSRTASARPSAIRMYGSTAPVG
jgi:hypothetical protein